MAASEFSNTWNYHRDFDIMHFGNPEAVREEPDGDPDVTDGLTPEAQKWARKQGLIPETPEPTKKKRLRYLRQPKGWFRT